MPRSSCEYVAQSSTVGSQDDRCLEESTRRDVACHEAVNYCVRDFDFCSVCYSSRLLWFALSVISRF